MRLIVMYDLDMSSPERVKEYTKFHKSLLSRGYCMMQYSVYFKTIISPKKQPYEISAIKKCLPKNGNIRVLTITNRQYYDIEQLRGEKTLNEFLNTEKRRIRITNENQ